MKVFLHVLQECTAVVGSMRETPRRKLFISKRAWMSIHTDIYNENIQQNPLREASCVTKGGSYGNKILSKNLKFFDKIFVRKS